MRLREFEYAFEPWKNSRRIAFGVRQAFGRRQVGQQIGCSLYC